MARKKNVSGVVGETEARERELYIENDGELYRRTYTPIVKNLLRRKQRGTYDPKKATQAFSHLVEAGARKYAKDFDEERNWHRLFNKPTRDLEVPSVSLDTSRSSMSWGSSRTGICVVVGIQPLAISDPI